MPFLGSLPLIGGLFRSEDTESVREEVVILLTPRILGRDGRVPDGAGQGPRKRPDAGTWGEPAGALARQQPAWHAPQAAVTADLGALHDSRPGAPTSVPSFDDVFGLDRAAVAGAAAGPTFATGAELPGLTRPFGAAAPTQHEPAALSAAYLATARDLLAEGAFASAGVMLDSLPFEQRDTDEVRALRDQTWRGLIGEVSRASVDHQILSHVMQGRTP